VKFAFIAAEKVAFPIAVLCRVLELSPSGYYASRTRPASPHSLHDLDLAARIRAAHEASKGRYGSPRVHAELRENGEKVSRKRVARLMQEGGLAGRIRRRFRATTDSNHAFPIAPNLLARDFTATAPNQVWVTDITAIGTHQGWLYLAARTSTATSPSPRSKWPSENATPAKAWFTTPTEGARTRAATIARRSESGASRAA
jgi:putative transposase